MALTIARSTAGPGVVPVNGGALQFLSTRLTFDSSYPTGGEVVTAKEFGLNAIHHIVLGASTAGAHDARYDSSTGKVLVNTSADGLQVADTTNLSAIIFEALVIGQ